MRRRLGWVVVPLGWALACGGRYQTDGEQNSDRGGSSTSPGGSSASRAGTASTAGGPVAGGGPTTAGTTAGGGVAGLPEGCECDAIGCARGYTPVPTGGACCFRCELDSQRRQDCAEQQASYSGLRARLLYEYNNAPTCTTAMDCTYYYDDNDNECQQPSCGIVVNRKFIDAIDAELDEFARRVCDTTCPAVPVPPCPDSREPICRRGYCL